MTPGQVISAFVFAVAVILLVKLVRWIAVALLATGHFVYEIDTDDGSLLYIGEAADVAKRMRGHRNYQARLPDGHPRKWWPDAAAEVQANLYPSRVTWYKNKEIAKAVEKQRIREKHPIANSIRYKGVISGGD